MVTFMAYNITDQIKCLEHKIVSYKLSLLMYHLELVLWCDVRPKYDWSFDLNKVPVGCQTCLTSSQRAAIYQVGTLILLKALQ